MRSMGRHSVLSAPRLAGVSVLSVFKKRAHRVSAAGTCLCLRVLPYQAEVEKPLTWVRLPLTDT